MVKVLCLTGYYDAKSRLAVHRMGFDEIRPHTLILHGMLLRVAVNMVEPGPRPKRRFRAKRAKRARGSGPQYSPEAFPDLGAMLCVVEFEPNFDETGLTNYINGFARQVVPLLNLEPESEEYIKKNLYQVIDYLVPKLKDGHLRFYQLLYSEISPEDGGAIAFLDVSDPAAPVFIHLAFGLMARTAGKPYIPWRPSEDETHEPEQKTVIRCKPDLDTLAPPASESSDNES